MMEDIIVLIVLSIIVETVVEVLKRFFNDSEEGAPVFIVMLLSIVISVILVFSTEIDILTLLGIENQTPGVARFLTGVIVGGGSNTVHNLRDRLFNIEDDKQEEFIEG